MSQLAFTVLMFYDVPLIQHNFDPRSAGLYAAAALVGRAILSIITFVPTVVMPKATARAAAGQSTLPLLFVALGGAGAIIGFVVLISACVPTLVVTLVAGGRFAGAAPLVFEYAVASGALALASVVAAYRIGLHRYEFVVPCTAAALLEICALICWHPTLAAVLTVLISGHLVVLAATLYRLNDSQCVLVKS
jgi:O-antigen/teichoic acid export membrane protein